jgi:putative ABC transport system permease protein
MKLSDYFLMAASNLSQRKLRTLLTTFAVVIGASLISVMVSLGTGVEDFITKQFTTFVPLDTIHVAADPNFGKFTAGASQLGAPPQEINGEKPVSQSRSLNEKDIKTLSNLPYVARVDEPIKVQAKSVRLEEDQKNYEVQVSVPTPYKLEKIKLASGKYFEEKERGKAVIAYQYLKVWQLNSADEILGKNIYIKVKQNLGFFQEGEEKEFRFEITGVTEKTLASTEIMVTPEDGKEMARFTSNNPSLHQPNQPIDLVVVKVNDQKEVPKVAEKIRSLGYGTQTPEDMLGAIGQIFRVIQFILSLFGVIALVIASLMIINTLIMSTYERTSEIGLMKSLGANINTIRWLFIIEGSLIGFLGGLIGIALGQVFSYVINQIAHQTFLKEFPTFNVSTFPIWIPLVTISISTIIALIASLYPANKASRLDPIEALKTE